MARFSKVLFWACVAAAGLGFYVWLGSVFWPLYFPALELHIWLGIAVVVGSSPALAWHLRKSRSRLVPTLLVPAAVLALLAVIIPGRPEYPAFGPIGWAAATTAAQLVITAVFMRFMSGDGTSVRTSVSGVVVTVVLLYGLHAGIFGWLMRGDERWGPMIAHSILGVFTSLLLLAHLPKVRDLLPGKRGPLVLLVSSVAVVIWWYQSYPHDLVLSDFGSPMDFADGPTFAPPEHHWDTPIGVMPNTREERAQPPAEPLDPAVIGDSASCGSAGCHPAITAQWAGSSHRYSADNAFYGKVVSLLVEERGVEEAAWCAACHDPVRVLAGTVAEDYKNGAPPPGDGVSCVVCHATWHIPQDPKNGSLTLRQPPQYPASDSKTRNHRIRLDPRFHRQTLVSNFRLNNPSLSCAPCHRLQVGPDIGAAVTKDIQNPFQDRVELLGFGPESMAPGETGYRGSDLGCTDCHMPTLTKIRDFEQPVYDHFLDGINLDLALYATGEVDHEAIAAVRKHTADFLGGRIEVDAFTDADLEYGVPAATTEVMREAGVLGLQLKASRRGDGTIELTTTTSNHRAGHHFPSGPFDLNEVWQEVQVLDNDGESLFHRGQLTEGLEVDPQAHRLGATEIARDGLPLRHHRIWDMAGLEDLRQIPMGQSVDDSYLIALPPEVAGPFKIKVSWRFRRANQHFVDWVFDSDGTTFPVHELAVAETEVL